MGSEKQWLGQWFWANAISQEWSGLRSALSHQLIAFLGRAEKGWLRRIQMPMHSNAAVFSTCPASCSSVIDKIMHAIVESWPSAVFIGSIARLVYTLLGPLFLSIRLWYIVIWKLDPVRSFSIFLRFSTRIKTGRAATRVESAAIVCAMPLKDIIMCCDKIWCAPWDNIDFGSAARKHWEQGQRERQMNSQCARPETPAAGEIEWMRKRKSQICMRKGAAALHF